MNTKNIAAIFVALLVGYSVSPSYSQDGVFCSGFESCPTDDGDAILELQGRVTALETLLADIIRGTDPNTGQDTLTFGATNGMNLQIVNGTGTTTGEVNGKGNLIVGYNENTGNTYGDFKTGSHVLVVGPSNSYSSFGGIVVGRGNTISGGYASVSAGQSNRATAFGASVSGGQINWAGANWAAVSGGKLNEATNDSASVSGGDSNVASAGSSSVSGGNDNEAKEYAASVSGGQNNEASGLWTSVSGGINRNAEAAHCTEGDSGTDC